MALEADLCASFWIPLGRSDTTIRTQHSSEASQAVEEIPGGRSHVYWEILVVDRRGVFDIEGCL